MSQPKRYSVALNDPWFGNGAYVAEDGKYVLYSDYAALAADRDKWKSWADAENKDRKRDHADACDYIQMIVKEKNALAAENERLRKAGDELYKWAGAENRPPQQVYAEWLAAKEGRDAK